MTYHNFPTIDDSSEEDLRKNNQYDDSNLLWFLNGSTDGAGHMKKTYRDVLLSRVGVKAYKEFFRILSLDNKVTYFHCSQGKDRAGLGAYMFLTALGVSEEDKRIDYLQSNEAMKIKIKQLKAMLKDKPFYNKEYERALNEVFACDESYLDFALDAVKKEFGSLENYMKEVLEVDFERLRELYLE